MHASTRLASGAAAVSARAGAAPRTRGARGGADASRVVPSPQCSVGTLKRSRSLAARALARGRDAAYYEWIDAKGIEAPSIGIGYVGGGIADDNETYRGCVATAPIAAVADSSGASAILSLPVTSDASPARAARAPRVEAKRLPPRASLSMPLTNPNPNPNRTREGDALVRCPANLAFAVPPGAPNPFPAFVPDETWSRPDIEPPAGDGAACALDEGADTRTFHENGRLAQEFRAALVLLHERSLGAASRWAPYLAHLPASYDLLSCWTDEQLGELRCAELEARAKAQRAENARAHAAVAACDAATHACASLTYAEMEWGLDTVRSRGFLGDFPETFTNDPESAPHPPYDGLGLKGFRKDVSETKEVPSTFVLPLLDAFNHLSERGGATKLAFDAASNAFTLRAARDMRVGDEVTISYGARSNGFLLLRFGFAVFDSKDETVPLPGCADELEWLMPGSAREAALFAEGLHHAVRGARVDRDGKANTNLLWALRVLLASDEDYERCGGAKGFRDAFPSGLDGRDVPGSGAQLAAEASLALACAREMDLAGGPAGLAEDETQLEAALAVLREVEAECARCGGANDEGDAYEGAMDDGGLGSPRSSGANASSTLPDPAHGEQLSCDDVFFSRGSDSEGDDTSYLRRLVSALEFRVGRGRILAKAVARYSPLREAFTRSGDALYAATMEGGDYDEKVG